MGVEDDVTDEATLEEWVQAVTRGDKAAAERLLGAIQGDVYRLSLRMLGHPEDAEDATQEILLVILTHLASFRGESSFRTWCWRVASHHLLRARRGRMERVTFDSIAELLEDGGRDEPLELSQAEAQLLAREVRLRCTEAMLLGLDRDLRIAFVLVEILSLTGEEAAEVLEVDAATYRKRLSRARVRLLEFLRAQCGIFDPKNPCRCEKQVASAMERGQLLREELLFARHPRRSGDTRVERCTDEVDDLLRAASVLRHPDYAAPPGLLARIRAIVLSERLELLRH
jgi:RNA polymerase sigma factor (sigma-70 family)